MLFCSYDCCNLLPSGASGPASINPICFSCCSEHFCKGKGKWMGYAVDSRLLKEHFTCLFLHKIVMVSCHRWMPPSRGTITDTAVQGSFQNNLCACEACVVMNFWKILAAETFLEKSHLFPLTNCMCGFFVKYLHCWWSGSGILWPYGHLWSGWHMVIVSAILNFQVAMFNNSGFEIQHCQLWPPHFPGRLLG